VSLSLLISVIFVLFSYLINITIFGADGATAPFQLFNQTSPFSISIIQAVFIYIAYASFRTLFFASGLLLLSSKLKSSFAVLICAAVWIYFGLFFNAGFINIIGNSSASLNNIGRLTLAVLPLPTAAFDIIPYEIFGVAVWPFVFEPIFAVIMSIIFLPIAGRVFKRHQIG